MQYAFEIPKGTCGERSGEARRCEGEVDEGSEGGVRRASSLSSHERRYRAMQKTVSEESAVNGSSVYLWIDWYA